MESAVGGPARAGVGPRAPQSGHAFRGSQTGGVSAGGGQERETVSDSNSGGGGAGGANRAVRVCPWGVHGPPPFPCALHDTEQEGDVQGGSLRRAKLRRALDIPLLLPTTLLRRGKGGRWKLSCERSSARPDLLSDPPAGPRYWDCPKKTCLLMGPVYCFEAGRLFQTQSSRTAMSCSRKWMSGHAAALAEPKRIDSGKSTGHCRLYGDASGNSFRECRRCVFSLDKPLSWMSGVTSTA